MRSHRRVVESLQAVAPTCSLSFVGSPVYADDSLIGAPGPGWLDKGFRMLRNGFATAGWVPGLALRPFETRGEAETGPVPAAAHGQFANRPHQSPSLVSTACSSAAGTQLGVS
jgi:hypothetical protein